MALVYITVAMVFASFGARGIVTPYADGDLFWQKHLGAFVVSHRALPEVLGGETFTAAGAPWVPQEWLFGAIAWLAISRGALWALAIAAAALVAVAFLVTVARARRLGAGALALVVCTAFLSLDVQGAFGIRAQVFAWPFFAGLLFLLDFEGPQAFAVLPLVALWANLHASAAIAIPLVWIDAAFRRTPSRLLLAALVPFAMFATPLGARLPFYALALVHSPIRSSITEWQPLSWHTDFFWSGAFPMLIVTALCVRALWRERARDIVWIALLTAMTVFAVRNAPLLGFALVPVAARGLDLLLGRFAIWTKDPLRSPGPRALAIAGGLVLCVVAFVAILRAGPSKSAFATPVATIAEVAAQGDDRRLFCYDFAVCSIALDYPIRVFMDGRADPYPVSVWRDFNTIRFAKPSWKALVNEWDVNSIVVKRNGALDKALRREPEWRKLPALDRCCFAYVRVN